MKKVVLGLVAVLISFGGYARVIKCTLESGEVIYTDKNCTQDTAQVQEVKHLDVNVVAAFKKGFIPQVALPVTSKNRDYKTVTYSPGWGIR